MARAIRKFGYSGIYHVILRGVNKQRIFEWNEDYAAFLNILQITLTAPIGDDYDDSPKYKLHAYCLMDNHVHLLIGEIPGQLTLPQIVKRIATRYARHFNLRYHRVGHLFQDRYKSEPCDDPQYFFRLLDYIHNNPVKAGISDTPEKYPYSSFCELAGKPSLCQICSTENTLGIEPKEIYDWTTGLLPPFFQSMASSLMGKLFNLFQAKKDNDPFMLDQIIVQTLFELSGASSITEFQQLEKKPMRSALAQVRDAGISIRHLSRLTGISEGVIRYSKNPQNLT